MRTFHSTVGGHGAAAALSWLRHGVQTALGIWQNRRRRRKAAARMVLLNDHLLRDIGLTRTDVLAARTQRQRRPNW